MVFNLFTYIYLFIFTYIFWNGGKLKMEILKIKNLSYSYSKETAKDYVDMGFYIGVGGVITFNNAKTLKEVVEYLPLERILLETDCPYLAPVPYRGKRNSSLYLPYIVKEIARIKNLSEEQVEEVTFNNAKTMYRI